LSEAQREAIVDISSKAKAVPYRPKRATLNWVDYLVIAATVMTFLAVLAANNPHNARAQTRNSLIAAADLPAQTVQTAPDPGLIKAAIGLRMAGL
jgi:hypothetical protein